MADPLNIRIGIDQTQLEASINRMKQATAQLANAERGRVSVAMNAERQLLQMTAQRARTAMGAVRGSGQFGTALQSRLGGTAIGQMALADASLGAFLGGGLGAIIAGLTAGLSRAAMHALRLSDNLKDMAEMFDLQPTQVYGLQAASVRSGAPVNSAFRGLMQLRNAMGQAGQDPKMASLLSQYGVTPDMLKNDDPMAAGQAIARSLGDAGATSKDIPALRAILGRNPSMFLATMRNYKEPGSDLKGSLNDLGEASKTLKEGGIILERASVRMQGGWLSALKRGDFKGMLLPNLLNQAAEGVLSDLEGPEAMGARTAAPGRGDISPPARRKPVRIVTPNWEQSPIMQILASAIGGGGAVNTSSAMRTAYGYAGSMSQAKAQQRMLEAMLGIRNLLQNGIKVMPVESANSPY
jgi:hypothetical protein